MLAVVASCHAADTIVVTDAWVRPSLGPATSSALYMTLRNVGAVADVLVGVATPVAAVSQLHTSEVSNGVVSMHALSRLDLLPGQVVELAPKGTHVMLTGLTQSLKAGDRIAVTLRFSRQAALTISAVVGLSAPAR